MGVKELCPILKTPSSYYIWEDPKILDNLVIGIDASVLMYLAMKHDACVQQFSIIPAIPVTEILETM
jgi:hypothetical protein